MHASAFYVGSSASLCWHTNSNTKHHGGKHLLLDPSTSTSSHCYNRLYLTLLQSPAPHIVTITSISHCYNHIVTITCTSHCYNHLYLTLLQSHCYNDLNECFCLKQRVHRFLDAGNSASSRPRARKADWVIVTEDTAIKNAAGAVAKVCAFLFVCVYVCVCVLLYVCMQACVCECLRACVQPKQGPALIVPSTRMLVSPFVLVHVQLQTTCACHNMGMPQHGHSTTCACHNMRLPQHARATTWACHNMGMPQHERATTWACHNMRLPQHMHALATTCACHNMRGPQHARATTWACHNMGMQQHERATTYACACHNRY